MIRQRPARPHLDVRYTQQLQMDSKTKAAARNAGDVGHFVGAVVFGNIGVAAAKLAEQVFSLNSDTKWYRTRHRQRKDERTNRGMERHYKDHKDHADRVAAQVDRDIAWAKRPLKQQRFDALVKVFERVGAVLAENPNCGYSSDDLNACVVKGLQKMLDLGVISLDEYKQIQVDGRPGLYHADIGNARRDELKLSALTLKPEVAAQCRAAIAWEYLAAGLVTDAVLEQAEYPKNEHGDCVFDESGDQARIESSSGGATGSQ